MAKGEGRGWRKFVPSAGLIVRVFVAMVLLKTINRIILPQVPAEVAKYWPAV